MQDTKEKLDLDSISFDDMIGEGLKGIEDTDDNLDEDILDEEEEEEIIDEEDSEDNLEEEDEEEDYIEDDGEDDDLEAGSVAEEIAKTLGFKLENEYADTVEGLTEFARDLAQEVAEDQLQSLFEQYPEVQKHLDYLMAGGDSNKFFETHSPQVNFADLQVDQRDVNTQKAILAQYFYAKGHDNEFIQDTLENYEDSGKLFTQSERARAALAQAQEEQKEQLLAQQQEEYQRAMEEESQFWDSVAETIESGNDFAGIKISDREKGKFFDYISEPVGPNGETQRDLDYAEADIELKLAIDYLVYNGFNLNDIIETKAKTKSAQNLRGRIQSNQERVKSARKASRRSKDFDPDDLDMTALF